MACWFIKWATGTIIVSSFEGVGKELYWPTQQALFTPVYNAIKYFWRKCWKSRFPTKSTKNRQLTIWEHNFALKYHSFAILTRFRHQNQDFLDFLILGKSKFPPKKFYITNSRSKVDLPLGPCYSWPVWPDKNRQISIKIARKWFHSKNEWFCHLYKNA